MKKLVPVVSLSLITAFGFSACETPGQTALAGAATGAAVGGLATGRGRGALVGAAVGAGVGYAAGAAVREERRRAYYYGDYDDGYYYDRPRGYYGRPTYYRESRYRRGITKLALLSPGRGRTAEHGHGDCSRISIDGCGRSAYREDLECLPEFTLCILQHQRC